jgi:hypothetical protein
VAGLLNTQHATDPGHHLRMREGGRGTDVETQAAGRRGGGGSRCQEAGKLLALGWLCSLL